MLFAKPFIQQKIKEEDMSLIWIVVKHYSVVWLLDIGGTKLLLHCENGEIEQRKQISSPQDDATSDASNPCSVERKNMKGSLITLRRSTGIINQGILTALNPKNLGGF